MTISNGTIVELKDPNRFWLRGRAHVFANYLSNEGDLLFALEYPDGQIETDVDAAHVEVVYVPKHMHVPEAVELLDDAQCDALYELESTQRDRPRAIARGGFPLGS